MPRSAIVASWMALGLALACGVDSVPNRHDVAVDPVDAGEQDAGAAEVDAGPIDAGEPVPDAGQPDDDAGPQLACPWAIWDAGAFTLCGGSQPTQSCINGRVPLEPACCIWGDGGEDDCENSLDAQIYECDTDCYYSQGYDLDAGEFPFGAPDASYAINECMDACGAPLRELEATVCIPQLVLCYELTTPQCCQ